VTGPGAIARDYVVSTTYRKHEQSGPKWTEARGELGAGALVQVPFRPFRPEEDYHRQDVHRKRLRPVRFLAAVPGAPSAKIGSIAEIALGLLPAAGSPPETVLATILEYVALPLRWEPLNGASQHRGIPSGGGLFGAELFVIGRDQGGPVCLRQVPEDGVLRHDGARPECKDLLADADLAFVIVGNLASFVNPYGEFSPCLVSLECGIMQAQLSLLCLAHGWTCEIETRHDYNAVSRALRLDHWNRVPAMIIRVSGPSAGEAIERLPRETISSSEAVAPDDEADNYPRMRDLIETIARETPPALSPPPAAPPAVPVDSAGPQSSTDMLEHMRSRTSGYNEDLNQALGRVEMADLAVLARDIATLHALEGRTDLAGVRLSLTLLATNYVEGVDCPFAVDLRSGNMFPAAGPSSYWNRLMFTIAVDDVAEERRSGSRAFLLNHFAAGALAQWICLAATAHGLFARPLRGYDEGSANQFLGLEHRAILQVACGVGRRVNPPYDLRWR